MFEKKSKELLMRSPKLRTARINRSILIGGRKKNIEEFSSIVKINYLLRHSAKAERNGKKSELLHFAV